MCSKLSTELIAKFLKEAKGFNRVMDKVKIITAGEGNCVAELKITEDDCNNFGTLHGGLSATLIDSLTTCALATHKNCGIEVPTVSVDIHISYMKAAVIDQEIVIDSKTLRVGKTLAYLFCEIKNKSNGDLLVTGTHTKFLKRPESS